MKRARAALAAGLIVVSACSTSPADYRKTAEKVIRDQLSKNELRGTVTCENPSSTDVGTVFECIANGADNTSIRFVAEITGKRAVTVRVDDGSPDAGSGTGS